MSMTMKVLSSYITPLFIWYQPMFVSSWFLEEPLGIGLGKKKIG
jgi:hypothetical protein